MALVADDLALAAYMFAAIMFILALRGLNRPESSKAGNIFGAPLYFSVRADMLKAASVALIDGIR